MIMVTRCCRSGACERDFSDDVVAMIDRLVHHGEVLTSSVTPTAPAPAAHRSPNKTVSPENVPTLTTSGQRCGTPLLTQWVPVVRGRQAAVGMPIDHLLWQALATRRGPVNLGRRVLSIATVRFRLVAFQVV
jgi:hypothetical protein